MSDYPCFDENISVHLVTLLIHLKVDGCHLTAHYPAGTLDPEFIPFISEKQWILVSGDARMQKTHAAVLAQYKIRALFMPKNFVNMNIWDQCAWTFKHWRTVQDNVAKSRSFRIARITDNGNIVEL